MSQHQPALFHETLADALGAAIQAAGGFKAVAFSVWPSLKAETAYARLKACLSDDKPEKLSLDELLHIARLARAAGDHSVMRFLCAELGYAEPVVVEPVDQRAALQRDFIAAVERLEQLQKAMAKVSA